MYVVCVCVCFPKIIIELYFLRIIYFVLTYEYVSRLLLSLENICGTMPYEWNTQ